jgi:hypothetical protein
MENSQWSARGLHASNIFDNKMWVTGGFNYIYPYSYNDVWYSMGLNGIEDNHQTVVANRFSLNADPNPLKTQTAIRYSVTGTTKLTLSIYDISGKIVKALVNEYRKPGDYIVSWDGKDEHDRAVAEGIYFYTLQTGNYNSTKKLILTK